jgi:SAM domain (Sterile alpha motif)
VANRTVDFSDLEATTSTTTTKPPNTWLPLWIKLLMTELRQRLDGLGLSQYADAFIAEGFDSWETLLDIQESDL